MPAHGHDDHPHDGGLEQDLRVLAALQARRRAMRLLGGAGAAAALATAQAARAACTVIPEETAGPYPGDGSNSTASGIANALTLSGIVRRDIRTSVGGATGTAPGVPFVLRIRLVNTNGGCASLAGYAIYLWHCTRDGLYSMYSNSVTTENFLRGVQATDSDGIASFTTVFPGCYLGRMPHIHFEIYRSLTTATQYTNKLKTSQFALPTAFCQRLYAGSTGYAASLSNLGRISFATDNVFSDGYETQMIQIGTRSIASVAGTVEVGIAI